MVGRRIQRYCSQKIAYALYPWLGARRIRLAVGAVEGQVLLQFLMEAMVLSLFGGIIGILLV